MSHSHTTAAHSIANLTFKGVVIALCALVAALLASCAPQSKKKQLQKEGVILDARVVRVDTADNICHYQFLVKGDTFQGQFGTQREQKIYRADDLILIVYLPSDPTVNMHIKNW